MVTIVTPEDYVNIVPLTLGQFRKMIELLINNRYPPNDFRLLMDKCLIHRSHRAGMKTIFTKTITRTIKAVEMIIPAIAKPLPQ